MVLIAAGFAATAIEVKNKDNSYRSLCIVKNATGYPCPSCGSTRAAALMVQGKFYEALKINPLAFITVPAACVAIGLLLFDILFKQTRFEKALSSFDDFFKRRKWMLWVFLLLVLLNWIWNIYKF